MSRAIAIIFGIVLAAVGGVIAYRAFFIDPSAAVVISERGVRELPNTLHVAEGLVLFVIGAGTAFASAVRAVRKK
jgi:hypothetical protein